MKKKIFVNVQTIQDGMDMDALLLKFVRMEKNGMYLSLCVNVP